MAKEEARGLWARRCDLLVLASAIQDELDDIERRRLEGIRVYEHDWAKAPPAWQHSEAGKAYTRTHLGRNERLAQDRFIWESRLRSIHDQVARFSALLTVYG